MQPHNQVETKFYVLQKIELIIPSNIRPRIIFWDWLYLEKAENPKRKNTQHRVVSVNTPQEDI